MKTFTTAFLLSLAVVCVGCAANVDDESLNVGEAVQPLVQVDLMGSYPWSAQAGWTPDANISHEVDGVLNKYVEVEADGDFPQFTGTWTATKAANCVGSTLRMILDKRANSGDAWSAFSDQTVNAAITYGYDANGHLTIDECTATVGKGGCGAATLYFGSSSQMKVVVYTAAADGSSAQKADIVRRSQFCN
jgi:hypothetical protein